MPLQSDIERSPIIPTQSEPRFQIPYAQGMSAYAKMAIVFAGATATYVIGKAVSSVLPSFFSKTSSEPSESDEQLVAEASKDIETETLQSSSKEAALVKRDSGSLISHEKLEDPSVKHIPGISELSSISKEDSHQGEIAEFEELPLTSLKSKLPQRSDSLLTNSTDSPLSAGIGRKLLSYRTKPTLITTVATSINVPSWGLAGVGNSIYLACDSTGVKIIDVTSPTSPIIDGAVGLPTSAIDVVVDDGYLYIADYQTGFGLRIVSLLAPGKPVVGKLPFYVGNGLILHNKTIHIVGDNLFGLVNVTIPSNPIQLGTCSVNGGIKVATYNNFDYVACNNYGLSIINITNPMLPKVVGSYSNGNAIYDVAIGTRGNRDNPEIIAYLANTYSGLLIVNVTIPSNPTVISSGATNHLAYGVTKYGNTVYVADVSGLYVFDVADPSNPLSLGYYPINGAWKAIELNNLVYVSSGNDPQLTIIDKATLKETPTLVNNTLLIHEGETVTLDSKNLAAIDHDDNLSSLIFLISDIVNSRFDFSFRPAIPISNFTQQQLWNGQVRITHTAKKSPPSYKVSVADSYGPITPAAANITFFANLFDPPVIINNTLSIAEGFSTILNSYYLSAISPQNNNELLIFNVTKVQHGYFSYITVPKPIDGFYQRDIWSGRILFYHDKSKFAPSYLVNVTDGHTSVGPNPALITFFTNPPILTTNTITISEQQTITITQANLAAIDPNHDSQEIANLEFLITEVQNGYFVYSDNLREEIQSFSQQDVWDSKVLFVHTGGINPPSYKVSVSDGVQATTPTFATIAFFATDNPPILVNSTFAIREGQTIKVTDSMLGATNAQGDIDGTLIFSISKIQNGYFYLKRLGSKVSVFTFTEQDISDGQVMFVQNGGKNPPSFLVSVNDGLLSSVPVEPIIEFILVIEPPVLTTNALTVIKGETVTITTANFAAIDPNGFGPSLLMFNISNLQHGYFEFKPTPESPGIKVSNFTLQAIINNQVSFVDDGSDKSPSFGVSVSNGYETTVQAPADIQFLNVNPGTSSSGTNPVITGIISSAAGVAAITLPTFGLRMYFLYKLNRYIQEGDKSGSRVGQRSAFYYQNTILPLVKALMDRKIVTGIMGYISKEEFDLCVSAVKEVVNELSENDVDTNLNTMTNHAREAFVDSFVDAVATHFCISTGGKCASCRCKAPVLPSQLKKVAKDIAIPMIQPTSSTLHISSQKKVMRELEEERNVEVKRESEREKTFEAQVSHELGLEMTEIAAEDRRYKHCKTKQ